MTDNQFVTVWLPRLSGLAAGYIVAWGANHNLTLDTEQVAGLLVLVYLTVHRLLSRWLNPGDATKTVLIAAQKATVAEPQRGE